MACFGFDQWEVTAKEWKAEERAGDIYYPTPSHFVILLSEATSVHDYNSCGVAPFPQPQVSLGLH